MDRSRVAIVIPARNESATIAHVVRDVIRYGRAIVSDDASSDGTGEVARGAGAFVVRSDQHRGYDAALDAGFRAASDMDVRCVITFDADGQHDPESLAAVLRELERGNDLVVGIRPRKARVSEWIFSAFTRTRYGIRDPLCGLKGYNIDLYRELGHFDSRGSIGTELMLYALRRRRKVVQVAIDIREREGAPRFGRSLRGNIKILRAMVQMMWA
jgi:glycosyltransferase involved in cell wall biosynthesis